MHLTNVDLSEPYGGAELVGLDRQWDLHSFAEFTKLEFSPARDEICLEWTVPSTTSNPWGSRNKNDARGCRLRCSGIIHFEMSVRDPGYPMSESTCVAAVSKAMPGRPDYPFKAKWEPGETFNLRFEFQDERWLEIGCNAATLEAVNETGG
jgi:hypothetical protein